VIPYEVKCAERLEKMKYFQKIFKQTSLFEILLFLNILRHVDHWKDEIISFPMIPISSLYSKK